MSRGAGRHRGDDQTIAVLHQGMADETEPGLLAQPFTIETGVGVGGRGVRVIGSTLAVKVPLAVASGAGGSPEPSFGRKLLRLAQASNKVPSTEKCSLDNKALTLAWDSTAARNLPGHLALRQPVAVLGEGGDIPYRVVDAEPDKPAEQQVVVEPVNQLPLRADRIERLQQQGAHQPLRRDRHPPDRRIELGKLAGQRSTAPRWRSARSGAADDPPEPASQDRCN